jgi:NADP-dependent 3-hydroxy acid dehydrogenase YdfG
MKKKRSIMNENIAGKVVVITGASSGLGEATARYLSAQGAVVVLGARRTERLQALSKELVSKGGKALALKTDVVDKQQVKNLVDAAIGQFGRIDVMLNNAGVMPQASFESLAVTDWELMIDVNIKGVLFGIAAVLPQMKKQQNGHIINVSSVAAYKTGAGYGVYSATKAAVLTLSEALRQEVKPYNLRTTVISPGMVDTELATSGVREGTSSEGLLKFYKETAIPAESFARMVAFAISQPEDVDINEILFRPTRQMI